jgi:prepilin-type N-terminal cleavage/methylation domain-containing protein
MPPRPRLTADCRAYSLIELLAVMAIISALASLTVGSLSPVKASALTAGGNQIADLLTSARQNSLARHAFTAVVIKTTGASRYSAFCLMELARNDNGTFSGWRMAAPWRLLPDGIRFDPNLTVVTPTLNFANSSNNPGVPVTLPAVIFRGQSVDLNSGTAFQVFAPDGTLTKAAPIRLRLLEGAEDSGTGIVYTGQQNAGTPANYYDIVLLRETGQAKVERF